MEEIIELLKQAYECQTKASKLLKELDVITSAYMHKSFLTRDGDKLNTPITSGIKKLAELAGKEAFHPIDYFTDKPDEKTLCVIIDGIKFYQTGKPTQTSLTWE